ncbi:PREDICTED: uncharacterized protein LOC106749050, partial [Dinoponera quadriceps]|uniref:Uncharacterized protein LOC106749049 n=1 Tax=Dinoponera quadriceps TaxID=609295 RepID=A0A6P3XYF2_DINQU
IYIYQIYKLLFQDDMEDLPFPSQEIDFSLPEIEFVAKPRKKEELDIKLKDQRDEYKEIKKEKDIEESFKKDSVLRDTKACWDIDKKKEDVKKYTKDIEIKKDKFKDVKDTRKEHKSSKGRSKGKDDMEECVNIKKERKDSESGRELLKRIPKRPRLGKECSSGASSSPRDTPPPKRRRI